MSQNKLFETEGLAPNKLPSSLSNNSHLCSYYFSVVWIRDGSAISLNSVVIAFSESNNWKQLLTSVKTENDGEITVPMGIFTKGTKLDIIFNLVPHQDISAAANFITNHNTTQFKKIAPSTNSKKLTKGKPWSAALTITLH